MCGAWVMKSRWLMLVGRDLGVVGWWDLFILNLNCSQCTASQLVPCKQNSTYQMTISSLLENLLFESNRRKFGKRVNEKIRQELLDLVPVFDPSRKAEQRDQNLMLQ